MARNRNNNNTAVDPQIVDIAADPLLRALRAQLAAAQVELEAAHLVVTETQPVYEQAKLTAEKAQNRALIGVARDGEVEQAQHAVEQARAAFARAEAHAEEQARLVRTLPDAIVEREQLVKTVIRDNLRKGYAAKLAKLAALVREAKQVSDEVDAMHYQAVSQFHGGMMKVGHGLIAAADLGEAGGYVGQAAGMMNLASAWLTNTRAGRNQPSMADLWLNEVEQYLAVTPEERAAQDVEHRVRTLARVKQEERDAIVNERAREELRRRIAERYAIPLSEVFV